MCSTEKDEIFTVEAEQVFASVSKSSPKVGCGLLADKSIEEERGAQ
jgi:hypothetical protein